MADATTTRLGLLQMEDGSHSNEWGDLTNVNIGRLDASIRGFKEIVVTTPQTLDATAITTTGTPPEDESFFHWIEFTGTPGVTTAITVQAQEMGWCVLNNTDSIINFTPAGGTLTALAVGKSYTLVYIAADTAFTNIGAVPGAFDSVDVTGAITTNSIAVEAYSEDANQYTATTGTRALDVSLATYFYPSADLGTATITFTFDNPVTTGRVSSFTMELLGADDATLTWPAAVNWAGGVVPIWSAGVDVVSFITRDGGTTWLAFVGGQDLS